MRRLTEAQFNHFIYKLETEFMTTTTEGGDTNGEDDRRRS
jgi:hypothetical protein